MDEAEVFARTLYGEARGQPWSGLEAVALVIVNRANDPGWWGDTVKSVCLKPMQFSCWNGNDPNREKLTQNRILNAAMEKCRQVATLALNGELYDFTKGSKHYATKSISPRWAAGKTPVVEVGDHQFWNDID